MGRSRPFWEWALPALQASAGDAALSALDVGEVYRAVNAVEPNLIRIESDEATYNLHIMLRYDLERAMLKGDLSVRDLPGVWNEIPESTAVYGRRGRPLEQRPFVPSTARVPA